MSLPFLPGYTSVLQGQRTNFAKSQGLVFRNGVSDARNGTASQSQRLPKITSVRIPPEFIQQKKAIKFEAYFKEPVAFDKTVADFRVRKCTIFYHFEDGSIIIQEPKVKNSGIPQGVLVKRHRIKKNNDDYFSVEDFKMGARLNIYGKEIVLCYADQDSILLLQQLGLPAGEPEDVPEDPYTSHRQKAEDAIKNPPVKPKPIDPLKKFIEFDRKVLRAFCIWDDAASGEIRKFKFHYFLADDTIEIVEQLKVNSGRDPFPTLVKRQKPPQGFEDLSIFRIGSHINIFNRTFVVCDLDEYTKGFLREYYGITDFTPIPLEEGDGMQGTQARQGNTPGSPAKKKNFKKLLDSDRKILRFSATMESKQAEDRDRSFIITYFVIDDTISIYEPPQRNSGIIGGKYLERRTVQKPGSKELYQMPDFYVGAVIEVYSRRFVLQDADEYAFNYMEANVEDFPFSDIQAVQDKIHEQLRNKSVDLSETFKSLDRDGNGVVSLAEFRSVLIEMGFDLAEQEIITLIRRYDLDGDGVISYEEFALALQE